MHCSVAHKFLDDVELGSDAIRSAVVEFMPYSFAAVNAQSKRFLEVSLLCFVLQDRGLQGFISIDMCKSAAVCNVEITMHNDTEL